MIVDTERMMPAAALDDVEGELVDTSATTPAPELDAAPAAPPLRVGIAASAAAAAAAWVAAGLFREFAFAHAVALLGVVIGGGLTTLSYSTRRPFLRYFALPAAFIAGAILVSLDARGGATLGSLVTDAVQAGGILHAPAAFEPGWRIILLVVFSALAAGAVSLGVELGAPRVGLAPPMLVTMGAALLQPPSNEIISAVGALLFAIPAMAIAYGADLAKTGVSDASFESRRLIRGAGLAAVVVAGLFGLTQLGILFPQPDKSNVVPPRRPPQPPPAVDRVLFSYSGTTERIPLRLGVLDIYDTNYGGGAWLLPPYDPHNFKRVTPPSSLRDTKALSKGSITVKFTVAGLAGHALPDLSNSTTVRDIRQDLTFDPRGETLNLADRPDYPGLRYTVVAPRYPTGKELAAAGPPSAGARKFLAVPPPPNEVVVLLSQYSAAAARAGIPETPVGRLQFLRQALYNKVVASGAGQPTDVPPSRVAQLLNGAEASPFEITATEALLARWSGVPSRLGYGYYGGEVQKDGSTQIRPRDGATWIEVYFTGQGWVPIVGIPPKATPSLSQKPKNPQFIQASDRLALVIYTPIREDEITLLYQYVQYYVALVLPFVFVAVILLVGYPGVLKLLRSRSRRRWARGIGAKARIGVAYAEFRDLAQDLTIGDVALTPIEFIEAFDSDPEHEELAWLTARTMWGDLRRDLREDDAEAAERLSASLCRRMMRAQPPLIQLGALIARTSLRDPFSPEMPRYWRDRPQVLGLFRGVHLRGRGKRRRMARRLAAGLATGVMATVLSACGGQAAGGGVRPAELSYLVPGSLGDVSFRREPKGEAILNKHDRASLVAGGLVYTVHHGDFTDGSIQIERLVAGVSTADLVDNKDVFCFSSPKQCPGHEVLLGMEKNFGSGHFTRLYVVGKRVYFIQLSDQQVYMWFPENSNTIVLMVLRRQFTTASSDALMRALIQSENKLETSPIPLPTPSPLVPLPSPSPSNPGGVSP